MSDSFSSSPVHTGKVDSWVMRREEITQFRPSSVFGSGPLFGALTGSAAKGRAGGQSARNRPRGRHPGDALLKALCLLPVCFLLPWSETASSQEHGPACAGLGRRYHGTPLTHEFSCSRESHLQGHLVWKTAEFISTWLLPLVVFKAACPTSSIFQTLGSVQAPSSALAGLAEKPGPYL